MAGKSAADIVGGFIANHHVSDIANLKFLSKSFFRL